MRRGKDKAAMPAHGRAHGQKKKAELGHSIAIHGIDALSHEQGKWLDHVGPCYIGPMQKSQQVASAFLHQAVRSGREREKAREKLRMLGEISFFEYHRTSKTYLKICKTANLSIAAMATLAHC